MRRAHDGVWPVPLLLAIAVVTASCALGRGIVSPDQADNEVTRFLEKLSVMPPHHYGGLTLFSIELSGTEDDTDYASLDEAIRGGTMRVSDTGVVERVTMENTSDRRWVFAMTGEVILGGKQNRMLREDVLLPPRSGAVTVPTYCVEKDRWRGNPTAKFSEGRGLGNYALRRKALAKAPQAEVWDQVAEEQRRFNVDSPTKDYGAVMASPAAARELGRYSDAFRRIWRPRTVGIVVAQGGRIVSADVFCNTRLFHKLRHKLVHSYAWDCVYRYRGFRPVLRQQDARDFMARIYTARFQRLGSPGSGGTLQFRGGGVEGSALAHRGATVHLHATPGYRILPPRPPHPGLPIVPQPR